MRAHLPVVTTRPVITRPVMRLVVAGLVVIGLAACAPPPDDNEKPARGRRSGAAPVVTPAAASPDPAPEADQAPARARPASTPITDRYRDFVTRIVNAAQRDGLAHDRLRHMCDVIGPRLSGSKGLARAVDWTAEVAEKDGMRVTKQKVMVPNWKRGNESATLLAPRKERLEMLGIGNSIGTPPEGITAEVIVATDFDELAALGDAVKGKIVLFNKAMPPYDPETGAGYGATVGYRTSGASKAGAAGAVAVLVRSVTATSLATPHTGMLSYQTDKPRIPAAAVSIEDAELIARLAAAGETVRVHLQMDAHFEEDAESANVIVDLVGSELPDEIVLISGHLDSWDVGQGAHDDGAACMAVLDAVRLLKSLGLTPRRTIRVVLWTNEENGLRGSREYIRAFGEEMPKYAAALEADSGIFHPVGFRSPKPKDERGERVVAQLQDILTVFDEWNAGRLREGGGGADIGAMAAMGVPLLGLDVEGSKYFDYHHTHADTFDKVAKDDLLLCEGVLAAIAYVLADMPKKLGD